MRAPTTIQTVGAALSVRSALARDITAVEGLLSAASLPIVGVRDAIATFFVADHEGVIVGVGGLELCDEYGLLRSLAVRPDWEHRGLARALVGRVIAEAQRRNLRAVYLLTMTAARYFSRCGFTETARGNAPRSVAATAEFRGACPTSALAMVLPISDERVGG